LYFLWKRKNWARITLITLLIVSLPGYVLTILMIKNLSLTYVLQIITNLILLATLFLKPTKNWFENNPKQLKA